MSASPWREPSYPLLKRSRRIRRYYEALLVHLLCVASRAAVTRYMSCKRYHMRNIKSSKSRAGICQTSGTRRRSHCKMEGKVESRPVQSNTLRPTTPRYDSCDRSRLNAGRRMLCLVPEGSVRLDQPGLEHKRELEAWTAGLRDCPMAGSLGAR